MSSGTDFNLRLTGGRVYISLENSRNFQWYSVEGMNGCAVKVHDRQG